MPFNGDMKAAYLLHYTCDVPIEVAMLALGYNGNSIKHAKEALNNEICRSRYIREVRDCGLGQT